MKIDFHTHAKLAKKLPFSSVYTEWLFKEAKTAGLDAICLTEHFNTLGFAEIYEYIRTNSSEDGDSFIHDGLRIFPGMEVDIAEGGHVLVIGAMDDILELNQELEPYKEKGSFLPFGQLVAMVRQKKVLLGAGHPYREGGHIPELSSEKLCEFDFIDLNGKDMAADGEKIEDKIMKLAGRLRIPYVAGSDTHQALQYGCIENEFFKEVNTIEELKRHMIAGHYKINVSRNIRFQVKAAGLLKKSLKALHAAGGDYVQVLGAEV